jgi:beta-galactosidase GanA
MRARGYAVMVLSPDPITFEAAEQSDFSSRFYRLAFAEREFMLQQLRQSGTQVISWQVDQPLEAALQRATFNQHRSYLTMRRGA